MGGLKKAVKKGMVLGEMAFAQGGGVVNWFPGHMAVATRAIRDRLKVADLVVEVRDSRIPLSSVNRDLQSHISQKKRIIALNKTDLANPNITQKWVRYFDSCKQDSIPINAHSKGSVCKLLELVELKLKERISREPTLLVMVVGVPNVGKSALINSIHQIASKRFPGKGNELSNDFRVFVASQKMKRARVGPLPGVTQDIAGFKIANKPSIYVLDTPGVLIPSIPDIETGLKLALSGSVKDSVVGEERLAQYLLAILNTRNTPLHWKPLIESKTEEGQYNLENSHECNLEDLQPRKLKPLNLTDGRSVEDRVTEVQRALYSTLSEFNGNYMEEENELEVLIEEQFKALQKALRIPHKASDARLVVSKKFISLFRMGKLGPIVLDDVPVPDDES